MAVRFLPSPEERPQSHREDRGDLAEVIEFRTRLKRPAHQAESQTDGAEPSKSELAGVVAAGAESDSTIAELSARISEVAAASSEVAASEKPRSRKVKRAVDSEPPAARDAAIKLLARRALSSGELRYALLAAEYPEIDVEQAVAECEESLYLDDADLARSVTRKLREAKGESRARIRQKLRERKLPDVAIEGALCDLDDGEELELLTETAFDRARRMSGLDRKVAERRLLGFLARRGWSGERATRAVREALDATNSKASSGTVRFQ
ncbi:MAG: regulatory protein RecX [Leucobacter sp.]